MPFFTDSFRASLVFLLIAASSEAIAGFDYRTVAVTGQQAPGAAPGVVFSDLRDAQINNAGQVAFLGILAGPDVTDFNLSGLWSEGGGAGLSLVARTGNPAVGTSAEFTAVTRFILNDEGKVAFRSYIDRVGTAVYTSGMWIQDHTGLNLMALEGDPLPGAQPDVYTKHIELFHFNATGKLLLDATDLWSGSVESGLSLITGIGEPAPQLGPEYTVRYRYRNTSINAEGLTPYIASITGQNVNNLNDTYLWKGDTASGFNPFIHDGDPAPGTNASFIALDYLSVNNAGHVMFQGTLTGPGIDQSHDTGIWAESESSGLHLIMREGDQVQGMAEGVRFYGNAGRESLINGAGQVVFESSITGPGINGNKVGIWLYDDDAGLRSILIEGEHAPGTAPGIVFEFVHYFASNRLGQVAVLSRVHGPGVTSKSDYGVWVTNHMGDLALVAREGDLFDINDDPLIEDWRTISSIDYTWGSGGEDGAGRGLNDAGQLALNLYFTDGSSGIFVFTVPEPGTLVALTVIAPLLLRRRIRSGDF